MSEVLGILIDLAISLMIFIITTAVVVAIATYVFFKVKKYTNN